MRDSATILDDHSLFREFRIKLVIADISTKGKSEKDSHITGTMRVNNMLEKDERWIWKVHEDKAEADIVSSGYVHHLQRPTVAAVRIYSMASPPVVPFMMRNKGSCSKL